MGFWSGLFRRSTVLSTPRPRKLQGRKYRAPAAKNSRDGFRPTGGHERVPGALKTISARSRDLAHNNPFAKRAVSVLTSHAIGRGIRISIRGDKGFDEAFYEWANDPLLCDHDGRLTFYGHQRLSARTMFEAGDGLIVMREVTDEEGKLRLTLQAVDPDLIDVGASPSNPKHECVSGVEVDETGRRVGIWLKSAAGGDAVFVPEADLIHLYEPLYPGQLRGIPRGAQALLAVDDLASLMEAMIMQAKAQACLAVFVTREADDMQGGILGGEEAPEIAGDDDGYIPELLEPAMVTELPTGASVSTVTPTASAGVIEYMRVSLRAVSVAYGVTYAQLSGDIERTTFSSEKSGRMEFNRENETVREHDLSPQFMKVVKRFQSVYEANGGVVSPNVEITIIPPARERIEPAKEILADLTEMEAGLKTFTQACFERGLDPDVQMDAIVAERRKMAERGIILKTGASDFAAQLAAIVEADAKAAAKEDAAAGNSTSDPDDEE